jgi:hypothetical protein
MTTSELGATILAARTAAKSRFKTGPRVNLLPRSAKRLGSQAVRRSRNKRFLTEWEIQRKIERFRLHQIQLSLDGWDWLDAQSAVQALETLLRARVRPARKTLRFRHCDPEHEYVLEFCSGESEHFALCFARYMRWFAELEERDTSYRDEYARKFYGVAA